MVSIQLRTSSQKDMGNPILGLFLIVLCHGAVSGVREIEDRNILLQQKRILDLLRHVYEPNTTSEINEISKNFHIEENIGNYRVPAAATNFLKLHTSGLLPRDGIFSILDDKHRREVISLFELFYFANDFDIFYKTACWARVNVNPGQFVYALMAAVNHREDMRDIFLPPIYEINPYFFFDAEVMQKATEMIRNNKKSGEEIVVSSGVFDELRDGQNNMEPNSKHMESENRLRYFTEDIALNAYNNYYHLNNPFWMNITEGRRGELFWYHHQQLLTRYLQERFSNDLTNFESFRINEVIQHGYNPRLRHPNGEYFSVRPDESKIEYGYDAKLVDDFERRIRDAIDLGFSFGEKGEQIIIDDNDGTDHLGHLVQSTVKSTNRKYYGNLYQHTLKLLSRNTERRESQNNPLNVLEHFETSLRDPLHYRVMATIVQLFARYKNHLPSYLKEDLEFPGVRIDSVEVDRLNTFVENFDVDVSNGIVGNELDIEHGVKVTQNRLNHSPFTYYINITAENPGHAMVRTFLGLCRDAQGREMDINERRKFMVQIDNFPIELSHGMNTIERKSEEISLIKKKHATMKDLYRGVNDALEGKEKYTVIEHEECGYPEHLLLPRGKPEGMPFSFFVVVTRYEPEELKTVRYGCGNGRGLFYEDQHPMGYPFDRVISVEEFNVPNFHEKEVLIYHTNANDGRA